MTTRTKPHYLVSAERNGILVRCETCDQTLAFVAEPDDVRPALDAHHNETHPEFAR